MASSNRTELQKGLYEVGMQHRRAVLGDAYVDNALKNGSTEFAKVSTAVPSYRTGHSDSS